jgi:hypothetical protein
MSARMQAYERTVAKPERMRSMTHQGLTNILWSFATLRWYSQDVLDAIAKEFYNRLDLILVQVSHLSPQAQHPYLVLVHKS